SKALVDLGWPSMPNELAAPGFGLLMGQPGRQVAAPGWFANGQPAFLPIAEDPRIASLRAGLAISRTDWSLVYSGAAWRAQQTEMKWAPKKQPQINEEGK